MAQFFQIRPGLPSCMASNLMNTISKGLAATALQRDTRVCSADHAVEPSGR
jgi:hypothetical protein